jgi:polyisoprenyl-phosphate glycosyltransferase
MWQPVPCALVPVLVYLLRVPVPFFGRRGFSFEYHADGVREWRVFIPGDRILERQCCSASRELRNAAMLGLFSQLMEAFTMVAPEGCQARSRQFPASIDIVIPCHNEAESLPISVERIVSYMRMLTKASNKPNSQFRVVLVDDGSSDRTWAVICAQSIAYSEVAGIKLARNYGHQHAVLAGLDNSHAEAVISLDADLQDDLTAIKPMVDRYMDGADVVLGVREDRRSDTIFKRAFAGGFYRLMAAMGIKLVDNHADFRLLSRKALMALLQHHEVNLFLRGIVTSLGFQTATVPYARARRIAGKSSYTFGRMLGLAVTGITAFSSAPLRLIALAGLLSSLVSLGVAGWVTYVALVHPEFVIPGWASLLLPISLSASLQLLSAGIIGEYVGRIYLEVKRRPRFLVDQMVEKSMPRESASYGDTSSSESRPLLNEAKTESSITASFDGTTKAGK